jgi:hypothetical protein
MSFWEKMQKDMNWDKIQKDMKKNVDEGLDIIKDGGATVSKQIEKLADDGKKKYKVFSLNMKVQDEFAKLGGQVYDLIVKKAKSPLKNRAVTSTIKKINKLEDQITKLKKKPVKKAKKRIVKKTAAKRKIRKKAGK